MNTKAIPTIDAILEAAREWRDDPGDPTLAKFLALVIDLHKAATHPGPGPCNVCCGMPLPSGKPCICGGTGTEWAETQGLRERCFELEDELANFEGARKALEDVPRNLKTIAEQIRRYFGSNADDLHEIAEAIKALLPYKLVVPEIKRKI